MTGPGSAVVRQRPSRSRSQFLRTKFIHMDAVDEVLGEVHALGLSPAENIVAPKHWNPVLLSEVGKLPLQRAFRVVAVCLPIEATEEHEYWLYVVTAEVAEYTLQVHLIAFIHLFF